MEGLANRGDLRRKSNLAQFIVGWHSQEKSEARLAYRAVRTAAAFQEMSSHEDHHLHNTAPRVARLATCNTLAEAVA